MEHTTLSSKAISSFANKDKESIDALLQNHPNHVSLTPKSTGLNKSQQMIAGIIANEPETLKDFISVDKGIYKILCKVLYDSRTPKYILSECCEGGKNDNPVYAFMGELFAAEKFSCSKLLKLRAENDSSLYEYVKITAINHLKSKVRAHKPQDIDEEQEADKNRSTFDKATSKFEAEERMDKFETRDLLNHIIAASKLNKFQAFIIARLRMEYEPDEIIEEYSRMTNKKLTFNYYYSQKSQAIKKMKEVGAKMK